MPHDPAVVPAFRNAVYNLICSAVLLVAREFLGRAALTCLEHHKVCGDVDKSFLRQQPQKTYLQLASATGMLAWPRVFPLGIS